jgi:hypothetical protein
VTPPTLTVAGFGPLRLAGRGFAPGERVRVTVTPSTAAPDSAEAVADASGGFEVAFPAVDPQGGLEGAATGDAGGRAVFQFSTG